MGLSASTLAGKIVEGLKENKKVANETSITEVSQNSTADTMINQMATTIAEAVVNHIQDNLIIKSKGFGYASTLVESTSTEVL